jgi:hypothetical protein
LGRKIKNQRSPCKACGPPEHSDGTGELTPHLFVVPALP